jgi:preprotein translocase subunit SecY
MFNMFAGGAVERMAIFALNIMPYISASIIMQLMTTVVADARAAEEGRRAGPQEDQPVHPLPHRGAGAFQAYGIAIGLEAARQGSSSPIRAGSSASRP